MNARELRVGNLVGSVNRVNQVHLPDYTPLKVFEINAFEVVAHMPDLHPATIETIPVISLSDIVGIPLNEEWLSMLGFEKVAENVRLYQTVDSTLTYLLRMVKVDEGAYIMSDSYMKRICYVHELQNLFYAMTGDELKTKTPAI